MVVAHRGASHDVAEHTLAAYVQAIATGADALECDVRLTRDAHLVCVHDRTVERTSNGRGPIMIVGTIRRRASAPLFAARRTAFERARISVSAS